VKSVLVDSDIVIEVLRRRDIDVIARWEKLANTDLAILYSPVTAAEIWHGARPSEHETIQTLFEGLLCVPVDAAVGPSAATAAPDAASSDAANRQACIRFRGVHDTDG